MLATDTSVVPESAAPGSERLRSAQRRSFGFFAAFLVYTTLVGSLFLAGVGPRVTNAVLLVFGLVFVVAHVFTCYHYGDAYGVLRDAYTSLQKASEVRGAFLDHFSPSQNEADRILTDAAECVKSACDAELAFRYGGSSALRHQNMLPADPEEALAILEKLSRDRMADLKNNIKNAQSHFYRLRDLARAQGYTANDSWKPYVGISVKAEQSGGTETI